MPTYNVPASGHTVAEDDSRLEREFMKYHRFVLLTLALGLLPAFAGCTRIEQTEGFSSSTRRLVLAYSSNVDGEIEPCG